MSRRDYILRNIGIALTAIAGGTAARVGWVAVVAVFITVIGTFLITEGDS